ncbi:hypothetical protein [Microbispora sp. GKU 823]|uniref:hypothetical protein n=1 Tax=Microbispora sp. GKU 823 TaxID=1652100 RepID=UPI001C4E1825|nr:hypothetical protein [Microbispora sp. GKU 823]
MATEPFARAIAEAEEIIRSAPHVRSEQDLAEGLDYLAGGIKAALHMTWAYDRDFPFFAASTGPYAKLGLDNPDTLYFHAYIRDDAEYVVTGRRGTTADLSFQVLNGDYSPARSPDSLTAFDDRDIEIAPDGSYELRFGPAGSGARSTPGPNRFTLGTGAAMLIVREVFSDWEAERPGEIRIHRADTLGSAPPPPAVDRMARRYEVAAKMLLGRLRTFLAFPERHYLTLPVNTMTEPRPTPGASRRSIRPSATTTSTTTRSWSSPCPPRAATSRPTRGSSSAACGTSRWTTSTTRPASPPTRPATTPTGRSAT